jgi:hypothetical protein
MTDPVNPIDPLNQTGEGKSYLERMKRGMSNDPKANPEIAKEFADRLQKYVEEGKAINAERNEYKKVQAHSRAGGSGGGDFGSGIQKMNKDIKRNYKSGGKISSASKRADGCCIKGKTKGKII